MRLIVRRVPISAEELLAGSPKARRRKTIPPEQLQMVLDGELSSTYGYTSGRHHRCRADIARAEVARHARPGSHEEFSSTSIDEEVADAEVAGK